MAVRPAYRSQLYKVKTEKNAAPPEAHDERLKATDKRAQHSKDSRSGSSVQRGTATTSRGSGTGGSAAPSAAKLAKDTSTRGSKLGSGNLRG